MTSAELIEQARQQAWRDEQMVSRILAGETTLYGLLMRRHNQRLYRVSRAILHDDVEAEDVMQDAYVRAYQHLADFEGRAKFSTWLTRIALHEALARSRRRSRFQSLDNSAISKGKIRSLVSPGRTPEEAAYDRELGSVLEKAILKLPDDYRLVFMLRDVEEMSTDETADCLGLTAGNVKVRLHRARRRLRKELYTGVGATAVKSFHFHATSCDRVVSNVLRMLRSPE